MINSIRKALSKKWICIPLIATYLIFAGYFYFLAGSEKIFNSEFGCYGTCFLVYNGLVTAILLCQPLLAVIVWYYLREKIVTSKQGVAAMLLSFVLFVFSLILILISSGAVEASAIKLDVISVGPYQYSTHYLASKDLFPPLAALEKMVIDVFSVLVSLVLVFFITAPVRLYQAYKSRPQ